MDTDPATKVDLARCDAQLYEKMHAFRGEMQSSFDRRQGGFLY